MIPDYLALVGDAVDGYPGISGCGPKTSAALISRYGALENFPPDVLKDKQPEALLFKDLATLRTDAPLFDDVDELRWSGTTKDFAAVTERIGEPGLLARARHLEERILA